MAIFENRFVANKIVAFFDKLLGESRSMKPKLFREDFIRSKFLPKGLFFLSYALPLYKEDKIIFTTCCPLCKNTQKIIQTRVTNGYRRDGGLWCPTWYIIILLLRLSNSNQVAFLSTIFLIFMTLAHLLQRHLWEKQKSHWYRSPGPGGHLVSCLLHLLHCQVVSFFSGGLIVVEKKLKMLFCKPTKYCLHIKYISHVISHFLNY